MPSTNEPDKGRERAALIVFTLTTTLLGTMLSFALFMAPVPLAVLIYRHGLRPGIITALVAGSMAGLFMGHPAAMLLVLLVMGLGVAIGEALRDKLSLNQILVVSWGVAYLSFIGLYPIARIMFSIDLVDATVKAWTEQLARLANMPGGLTFSKADIQQFTGYLKGILPGMMALSAAGLSLLNYWLTGRWLQRMGIEVPWFKPFALWRFPWYMAWGYIAGIGLPYLQGLLHSPVLGIVAGNLELVFRFVFLLQGLAVLWYYFMRWRMAKPVATLLTFVALFLAPLPILLGLLDVWFDLRHLG